MRVSTTLWLTSGEFAAERGGGGKNAAHAGHDAGGDAFFRKAAYLFVDGPVHGGVAGVQADDALSGEGGLAHQADLFLKVHGRAVAATAAGLAAVEQAGIDERSGVEHEIGLFQRVQAAQGDQVFGAGSGSDESDGMDAHRGISFWKMNNVMVFWCFRCRCVPAMGRSLATSRRHRPTRRPGRQP